MQPVGCLLKVQVCTMLLPEHANHSKIKGRKSAKADNKLAKQTLRCFCSLRKQSTTELILSEALVFEIQED